MRKPVVPSPFATGSTNRFVRSSFGGGVSASHSNTRVPLHGKAPASVPAARSTTSTTVNLGLNSERSRGMLLARLRKQGDRKSVVSGKSVSVRLDLGRRRILKNNNYTKTVINSLTSDK